MTKILCIYDEGSIVDTPLIGAKGSSVLIEAGDKRILFDTGLRDRYLVHNLEYLEIGLESIDLVVLSQACPDNCRAINGILDEREGILDILAPAGLLSGKKGFLSSSVGLSDENKGKVNIRDIDGWEEIASKVWVSPQIRYSDGSSESVIVIEGRKLTVISGRGAFGPGPILEAVYERFGKYPGTFVGSILLEKRKAPVAETYANQLDAAGCTDLHLNHCTGVDGMSKLRQHFGLKGVNEFYVGMSLDI